MNDRERVNAWRALESPEWKIKKKLQKTSYEMERDDARAFHLTILRKRSRRENS